MRRVAVQASNATACVHRGREVPLLALLAMASQAKGVNLLCGHRFEADDLGYIASPFDVG